MMKITNIMKYTYPRVLLTIAAAAASLFTAPEAMAFASCSLSPGTSTQYVNMNLSQTLTSGTNIAGRKFDFNTFTSGFKMKFECAGTPGSPVWTNVSMNQNIPVSGTDGPWTYYRVDDYFSIAFSWNDCSGSWYIPVGQFNGICGIPKPHEILADGSYIYDGARLDTTWTVRLRVERAFSGPRVINFPNMFRYYYGDVPSDAATLQMISLVGSITVPETCAINAGQTIQVDFGNIGAGLFETAGQKPSGYTPVTTTAPVTCNDAAAARNVKVSLAATAAPGMSSAIRTSNPDVGIVVQ
ncbi:fimbrial protein, partial [Enterobacter sp. D2]|uniref:fimbrial protein n=1 Tax=Enterobacter sp. D2 TaxID=3102784 RepID=UPI002ACA4F50